MRRDNPTLKYLILLLLLNCVGCETPEIANVKAIQQNALDDLTVNIDQIIQQLPHVAAVLIQKSEGLPTHRIIQIKDWHFVSKQDYAIDLRDSSSQPLTDAAIEISYIEFLKEVDQMQLQQMALLRALVERRGVKRISVEGLIPGEELIYLAKVSATREVDEKLIKLRREQEYLRTLSEIDAETDRILKEIAAVEYEHQLELLRLGAVGRLIFTGDLEGVLGCEDQSALAAASPIREDGAIDFDRRLMELREDAIVKELLSGGPLSIAVIGGAHDLGDNLKRLGIKNVEYFQVELQAWKQIQGD